MDDRVRLLQGDCLTLMRDIPADSVSAIVTDPPYGMGWNTDSRRYTLATNRSRYGQGRSDWGEVKGDDQEFDPSPWLTLPKVILWGSNHYAAKLPVGTSLVWIKKEGHLFGSFLSDAEIGWMKGGHGVYCFQKNFPPPCRIQEGNGTTAHPTQKPIALMRWCIERLNLPPNSLILDPYMGSGSTGVAALKMGHRFIGIEIDPGYFRVAQRRLAAAATPLFDGPAPPPLTAVEAEGGAGAA